MIYQVGLSIWNSLATELDTLIPQWLNSIGKWASSIWDWIVKSIPVALAKLGEWASGLWGYLVANLPTWIQHLVDWATAAWAWIVQVTPIALAKLGEWGSALLGYLGANLPGWVATFLGWGTALFQWIGQALPNAINALSNFIAGLRGEGSKGTSQFWTMVGDWAKAFWTWITDVAMPQIAPAFAAFMGAVKTAGANILSALGNLAGEFGKTLWYWITLAMPKTAAALLEWWNAITKWLSTTGVQWTTTLAGWGSALWQWIATAFGPVVEWLGRIAAQFISWKDVIVGSILALSVVFAPMITGAFAVIMDAIGGFVVAWAPVLALFAGAIVAVSLLRNGWERDWGGIRTNTMAALTFLGNAFAPLGAAIQQFGSQSLAEIIAWATGNQTNFAATQKIWEAAKTSFGTVFDAISAKLSEWAKIAWDWFQTNFPNAAQTASAAIDSIKSHWSLFVEVAHPLIVKIQDAWNKLVSDWKTGGGGVSDAMSRLKNVLDNLWSIMLSSMQFSINTVLNLFTLVVQMIDGDWAGAWKTAQNMVHDAWEYIKSVSYYALDAIAGLFGSNANTVLSWVGRMVDGVKNAWNQFYDAGRSIIQGLWQGIQDAWGGFISFLNGLWNSLPASLRYIIQSHSPSQVFADIGSDMIAGLAQGINGSQQFVVDAMGNLIASTKKAGQWDKLGDAIGMSQATAFANSLKAAGLNALSDIKRAGIGDNSNAFDFATQLTQSSGTDTIGNLQNTLNNLITQFDALGLTNSGGAGTRDSLSSLSGTLGDLLSTGNYYAPYNPSGGTVSGNVGGGNADTNKLLQAILTELQRDGKYAQDGVTKLVAAVGKISVGGNALNDKVNGKVNMAL